MSGGPSLRACAMIAVAIALGSRAPSASAGPESGASPAAGTRVLTDLDDARACEPLDGGGVAVGTGGGLALVGTDGRVRVLTSLDGLPDTRVHALALAQGGDALWVGTEAGAALVSLAAGAPRVLRAVASAPVQVVHVTGDGAILLGTRGAGVLRLASRGASAESVPSATRARRVAAIAERAGTVYVAYADGPLARLGGDPPALRAVDGSPTHGQSLASVDGTIVLGDLEGLYRLDPDGLAPIASVDARGLAASGDRLLVATYGAGLETGSARGALHEEAGVPRLARGVGARGVARCVATAEGVFLDRGAGTFRRVALGGPPSNDVTALVVSPSGRVAVGTFEDGAALREGGGFRPVAGVDRRETVNGMAWQGEALWLATAHGLVRVPKDGVPRRFTSGDGLPATFTRAVRVLSADRVLVGTDAGPALVEGDCVVPVASPGANRGGASALASPMHATYAVGASADGTLFVGTTAGLYYGTPARGFRRASLATGELPDDWVTALAAEGRDVFVGTYAEGVTRLRFAPDAPRPTVTLLGGGYVNDDGLAVVHGKLWAATMDGLLARDLSDAPDASRWELHAGASTGRDVTAVAFAGGATWVASRRGIVVTEGGEPARSRR